MPQYNNQPEAKGAGIYRFRFYRMGEWMDVIIDDQLPKRQHAKDAVFYRRYPILYHKFGNIVIVRPGDLYSLCSQETRIIRKLFSFNFLSKKVEIDNAKVVFLLEFL